VTAPRGRSRFRQSDLLRAMKAAQKAGGGVDFLPDGTIRYLAAIGQPLPIPANPATDSDDAILAEFRARHGYQ